MKKENEKSVNDKLIDLMLLQQLETTKHFIEFYENQLKFLNRIHSDLVNNEPLKIFHKTHKEWKSKKNLIYDKIKELEKEHMDELVTLEKILENLYEKDTKKKKDKSNE